MADRQVAVVNKPTETAIAAAFSLAPVVFLTQLKANFPLDNLHVALLQLVLLFVFRAIALAAPNLFSKTKAVTAGPAAAGPAGAKAGAKKKVLKKAGAGGSKGQQLDVAARKFLTLTMPDLVDKLEEEPLKDRNGQELKKIKLADWTVLMDSDDTKVLEHPSIKRLYAISERFPDTPLKKIWDVLIAIDRRPKWDGLCDKGEQIEEILEPHGRRGSIAYMTMRGMFPVKASDLCVMSTIFRLPPHASSLPGTNQSKKVNQLIAATMSTTHPQRPESRSYQRLNLYVSGFIVEEDGEGGCRVTQVTDLSGLPSWVPDGILKTVTKNLIPQSMNRVAKVAKIFNAERDDPEGHPSPRGMKEAADAKRDNTPLTGDKPAGQEWQPPLIGSWRPKDGSKEVFEEEEEVEGGAEESVDIATETPQTYAEIISRLKGVTAQLAALEGKAKRKAGGAGEGGVIGRALGGIDSATVTAAGGALGLATATALLARWWQRKRI